MNNLQSLLQERELLENKIREARREQISEAIATCRRLIAEHELTEGDLFGGKGRRKKSATAGWNLWQLRTYFPWENQLLLLIYIWKLFIKYMFNMG